MIFDARPFCAAVARLAEAKLGFEPRKFVAVRV